MLIELHLELSHGKFLVADYLTIGDFVLVSYSANVINNANSPFSAVT